MALTCTRRRILIATLVVVCLAVLASLRGKSFQSGRFYEFMEQHETVQAVVRPVFVLAGKEAEFDSQIVHAIMRRDLRQWPAARSKRLHVETPIDSE
jgi:hypothetical protein